MNALVVKQYFQKTPWPAFAYNGEVYNLLHLSEFIITVTDSNNHTRKIAVTFEDHCFTRDATSDDTNATIYPSSTRNPGHFCFNRYTHSLNLTAHINKAVLGNVKISEGRKHYAIVDIPTINGINEQYAIFFSLDPVKGLPIHLHMRVRSAYAVTTKELITHGTVAFKMLIALRMQNKTPHKRY